MRKVYVKTQIEIEDSDIAMVFTADGELRDIYFPDDDTKEVPELIVKIVELATGTKIE